MNKKPVFIICGISVAVVTLVLVIYLQLTGKFSAVSPISQISPTPVAEILETWTDPAQFSFRYPKELSLSPHNEDQENYAHVELTSATHSGNLIVWVKDTTADTIDDWVTQNKIKNAIDSELASVSAKKVLATDNSNKVTISTINGGYLYQIEVNPTDSDYWNKTFNGVVSSFKFTPSEQQSGGQDTAGDTDQGSDQSTSEGEEVIE